MKLNRYLFREISLLVAILSIDVGILLAQEDLKAAPPVASEVSNVTEVLAETEMDLPGQYDENFGMQPGSELAKTLKPLSKIDMDGDNDYDGSIDNSFSPDQGAREYVPPGLELGVGELTKLVIRYKTYEKDFPGNLYVQLSVVGLNRLAGNGRYTSDEEELKSTGRIKVWAEQGKKTLLLDSGDLEKRSYEWKIDKEKLKTGLPGSMPRTIYVEGVEVSKKFEGDIRLLISSGHSLSEGDARDPSSVYKTAFDHMLFTIREEPVKKDFINNNAEGVWPDSGQEEG